MENRMYVGNLSFETTSGTLSQVFSAYGQVTKCDVVVDHQTKRSKGFAFVDMTSDDEAAAAIAASNGLIVDGRPLRVSAATDRPMGSRTFARRNA